MAGVVGEEINALIDDYCGNRKYGHISSLKSVAEKQQFLSPSELTVFVSLLFLSSDHVIVHGSLAHPHMLETNIQSSLAM